VVDNGLDPLYSVVDNGLDHLSCQIKDYTIGMCCFSA
jgi:hypothetical protein